MVSIFEILPPAGFEPMTLHFSTYLPNYLTCPNQLRYRLTRAQMSTFTHSVKKTTELPCLGN